MEIHTLASGSGGNSTLISESGTAILIDAGISARALRSSLSQLGFFLEDISGIFITHEHTDHIKGLATLLKGPVPPIFAPRTVANHLRWSIVGAEQAVTDLLPREGIRLGSLTVTPFLTLHDTPQSVGYRIDGEVSLGYCTDCGTITDEILNALTGVDIALIESNHDIQRLMSGPYPPMLKRRILSDHGHLSNVSCGDLAVKLAKKGTRYFILAHLSRENNTPELALDTVSEALIKAGFSPGADVFLTAAPEKDIFSLDSGVYFKC